MQQRPIKEAAMSAEDQRPDRTEHGLHSVMSLFDSTPTIRMPRNGAEYLQNGHSATTLIKEPLLRVVLICMQKDAILHAHRAPGPFSLTVLEGSIVFRLVDDADNNTAELRAGHLLFLAEPRLHEVIAVESSAFVLTLAHPKSGAGE